MKTIRFYTARAERKLRAMKIEDWLAFIGFVGAAAILLLIHVTGE